MKNSLVVSYYKENLSWLAGLEDLYNIYFYNKTNTPLGLYKETMLENVGREAHSYVYHILKNYRCLPEWTLFCEGNYLPHTASMDFPHAIRGKIDDFPKRLRLTDGFIGLGEITYKDKYLMRLLKTTAPISEALFKPPIPERFYFSYGAIFFVRRENIINRSRAFWKKCLEILENEYEAPWVFERIWAEIFDMSVEDNFSRQ